MSIASIDRLATVHIVHPLRRPTAGASGRIPILMYHSISDDAENGSNSYYLTSTSARVFAEQMQFLHSSGYQAVSLDQAFGLSHSMQRAKMPVVITFDDGYKNFYTTAYPVLRQYDFTATVFLPTSYIGPNAGYFKGKPCLSWQEIHELHRARIRFGSHTVTHPQLRSVSNHQRVDEIQRSKDILEQELGDAVNSFCYPFAFPEHDQSFCRRLRLELTQAGYEYGVTTIVGVAESEDDKLFLRRLPISSRDDVPFLAAKLAGAYDWFHKVQLLTKVLRG